jgi:aspartate carbamoyltransferase catalytic subunit
MGELRHILEPQQFKDRKLLDSVLDEADRMMESRRIGNCPQILRGKVMTSLFFEPSTRTRLSFESAMLRLGGSVIGTEDAFRYTSAYKGESLEDIVQVVGRYADVLVIRHPDAWTVHEAAKVSPVPVINAGDGPNLHPTQSLIDLHTIRSEIGRIDDFSIAIFGDLFYSRGIRNLIYQLSYLNGVKLFLVSPKSLRVPDDVRKHMDDHKMDYMETESLESVAAKTDIIYAIRIQKERLPSKEEYLKLKGSYLLDKSILDLMKKDARILHILPRIDEVTTDVDSDPRAAYFRQAENGLYVRMALLKMILGDKE